MNWKFWKKPPVIEAIKSRVLVIPDEDVLEILGLIDTHYSEDSNMDNVSKYHLWMKVQSVLPDTVDGLWRISVDHATKITVTEKL